MNLDISMHVFQGMQILDSFADLSEISFDFILG